MSSGKDGRQHKKKTK